MLSDVAPEMTAIAAARAAALGSATCSARELDLEAIDEPDASYDVVLCREGLMFAPDPARAAREIRRVLRPRRPRRASPSGARASATRGSALVFDAVSAQLGAPVPPPGVPGPFSLATTPALAGLLAGAGLADVAVERAAVPLRAGSFDEWWTRTSALAGPLAQRLAALPEPARQALEPGCATRRAATRRRTGSSSRGSR